MLADISSVDAIYIVCGRTDIFYNTVGGVIGGLMYCAVMKAKKRL